MNRRTTELTFEDALRITGPKAFNLMIKPAGSLCNLRCHYCYYLDKAGIYGGHESRMSLETLETLTRKYIEANDVQEVSFTWHGGEPLLMGLDFYRKALEFQKKYADGKTIRNSLQTNGTLVTPEWAGFFRDNDFLIGVSIDGPKDIHDRYRKDRNGAPTFERALKGVEYMYRAGVEYNIMATVNRHSEGRGLETYLFLKSLGTRFIQFMPVLEHVKNGRIAGPFEEGAEVAPWSVSSLGFGRFLCDVFDYWVKNDEGIIFVNQFDATLANWCGVQPGTCAYAETCGGNAVVEHNGDLYPCDHFVYGEYKVGNVIDSDLRALMSSGKQTRFGTDKRNTLPQKCFRCRWLNICHGECPKHRFDLTEDGEAGLNALCEGYRLFYRHVEPYMESRR